MHQELERLMNDVLAEKEITREEALWLYHEADLGELSEAAEQIRRHFCDNHFDLCTIINGKSGRCSENCAFCSQSSHFKTGVETYELLDTETILQEAQYNEARGVLRYAVVTSGRRLSDQEVDQLCDSMRVVKDKTGLSLCVSGGLLSQEQFRRLKEAGITRIHNNLETSERFFGQICTTHDFADKVQAIKNAQAVGLEVCSGGIFGLGESVEDRIDMALSLRALNVNSVPINMLNPIAGTPLEHNAVLDSDTLTRIVAVYRFILPKQAIRLAGGRGLLEDNGRQCFQAGANALITGDMLTTTGTTIEIDTNMLHELGFEVALL